MTDNVLHALRRFGFGRRGTEPLPPDATAWLHAQLDAPDPVLNNPMPDCASGILVGRRYTEAEKAGQHPTFGMADRFGDDMTALLRNAATTDLQVRERLVWFWANHFTVSGRAGNYVFGLAGAYVHQAIRPYVTGRFADMVKAVALHPAMLSYLDNAQSVGPDSLIGRRDKRGLNENLARECLELHTMGVNAGYTQQDVTTFAQVLTGCTVDYDADNPGFVFRADRHEPGPKTLLGRTFPEGFDGIKQTIEFIATRPETYNHIATQLVRHFVADTPPPECVASVAAALTDTDGDLKQAMLTIIAMPQAWIPLTKFRAPAEYVVAVQRALDLPFEPGNRLLAATADLGQPFMGPLLPNGWPDTAGDWISGERMLKRADWAMTQAGRPGAPSADTVAANTLADLCSQTTRAAYTSRSDPKEALATILASPEFMRR